MGSRLARSKRCQRYHTPHPSGYAEHEEWAERMMRTHRQARCVGCGLWAVWIPKRSKLTTEQYQRRMEARAA